MSNYPMRAAQDRSRESTPRPAPRASDPPPVEAPASRPGAAELIGDYLRELTERFGQGWTRFWFTPSDPFTLCVVRVLTGLVAFYTLLTYTPDLDLLFGPNGLLTVDSLTGLRGNYFSLSYLFLVETPAQLWAVHLVGLAVVALFTVGLFTRVTTILSLIVMLSYFHRSFIITSEMEPILTFVMFYLCFAPAGAYLSVDRWLARRRAAGATSTTKNAGSSQRVDHWSATVAARLIQVHLTIVYVMMLLAQLNENAWWDGTAIWWLVGRRESSMTDLTWLHAHPWAVNAWTHGFVAFEAAFIPLAWNRLTAPLMVLASFVAWGSMAIVTGLLPLAAIMVIAGLAFLPGRSMRTLVGCCGLGRLVE